MMEDSNSDIEVETQAPAVNPDIDIEILSPAVGQPNSVFHLLTMHGSDNEDMAELFFNHLTDVFAHTKKVIIKFCEGLDISVLGNIRNRLSKQLVTMFALEESLGTIVDRRKSSLIAEDIYVIGFSIVSKKKHKNLNKIFKKSKPDGDTEVLTSKSVENKPNIIDTTELFSMCISFRNEIKTLNSTTKDLEVKVHLLEEELYLLKMAKSNINLHQPANTIEVIADVHQDINGNKQIPTGLPKKPVCKEPEIVELDSSDDNSSPFRHTTFDRKRILKKPKIVTGSNMETVVLSPKKITTKLVYVGKLDKEIDSDAIRCHLTENGVKESDIADILRLNTRNQNEASYCISLNNERAESVVLSEKSWPNGIRVRKFYRTTNQDRTLTYSDKSRKSFHRNRDESKGAESVSDDPRQHKNLDRVSHYRDVTRDEIPRPRTVSKLNTVKSFRQKIPANNTERKYSITSNGSADNHRPDTSNSRTSQNLNVSVNNQDSYADIVKLKRVGQYKHLNYDRSPSKRIAVNNNCLSHSIYRPSLPEYGEHNQYGSDVNHCAYFDQSSTNIGQNNCNQIINDFNCLDGVQEYQDRLQSKEYPQRRVCSLHQYEGGYRHQSNNYQRQPGDVHHQSHLLRAYQNQTRDYRFQPRGYRQQSIDYQHLPSRDYQHLSQPRICLQFPEELHSGKQARLHREWLGSGLKQ